MTTRRFATLLSVLAISLMTVAAPAAADSSAQAQEHCIGTMIYNLLNGEPTTYC